jgi:hypothetical protein
MQMFDNLGRGNLQNARICVLIGVHKACIGEDNTADNKGQVRSVKKRGRGWEVMGGLAVTVNCISEVAAAHVHVTGTGCLTTTCSSDAQADDGTLSVTGIVMP